MMQFLCIIKLIMKEIMNITFMMMVKKWSSYGELQDILPIMEIDFLIQKEI